MASNFLIQVLHKSTGEVMQFEPGKSVEAEFTDAIVKRVLAKKISLPKGEYEGFIAAATEAIVKRGVGFGTTEAHVAQDVQDGLREVIAAGMLQNDPLQTLIDDVELAVEGAFLDLKKKVQPV